MSDMHVILKAISRESGPMVLATIVRVQGHSYRKEGAAMLFRLDGTTLGHISPGCLESDLSERVEGVWSSGIPELVDYNMRPEEDAIWGEAVGCGGDIRVLLEPIHPKLRKQLMEAYQRTEAGETVVLLRDPDTLQCELAADVSCGGSLQSSLRKELHSHISVVVPSRPRLLLFGAGRDAQAINSLAGRIGFQVTVADWRSGLCDPQLFPGAEFIAGSPGHIAGAFGTTKRDYIIVCSHQQQKDREMLKAILPANPQYIGVLGSKKRVELLFEGLQKPSSLKAPIGFAIGADGPDEIAVSVAAELIAVRSGTLQQEQQRGSTHDHCRIIFGGRTELKNGKTETVARAVAGDGARGSFS